jgi:hypothetical protein
MKVAYADPPYHGQAKRHYGDPEIDFPWLFHRLMAEFPDGWAMSCSSPSLQYLLTLAPDDVRVMAWVKPFASFKPNVNPAYAWEPVIVRGGRKRTREEETVRDWVAASITLKRGLVGVKPDAFSRWLFSVLGLERDDEFCDLYPGSGAVSRAWEAYCGRLI